MGDYEKHQLRLQKLWDELLSNDEDEPLVGSSDDPDYEADELERSSSSGSETPMLKKKKISDKPILEKKEKMQGVEKIPPAVPSCSFNVCAEKRSTFVPSDGHISEVIESVVKDFCIYETSEDEIEDNVPSLTWSEVTGANLKKFQYEVENGGISLDLYENMFDKSPIDFYSLFLNDSLLEIMVEETNRYATQKILLGSLPKSRISQWKDTSLQEMKTFIGLQLWMGLFRLPRLTDYWSKKLIYSNKVAVMSRNRFELLLSNWHFSNNEAADVSNRLYKLMPVIQHLTTKFKQYFVPGEQICIDETLVPFRGRLIFLQYIKNKKHKFGVKLFKLCVEGGYTYDFKIYCGKEKDPKENIPTAVVMNLCDPLLDCGRTVCVDNYYTSVDLAHKLLERKTHLVGTLRKNRKNNPKPVIGKNLKKGESISMESNTGIVVTKWQDKRDVLTLSTKHVGKIVKVSSGRNAEVDKPDVIVDYNKSKAFIDLSDQIKAYSTSLRKGIKWYRKIAVELLLGSAMVNAYLLYKGVTGRNLSITAFREEVAESLLGLPKSEQERRQSQSAAVTKHMLIDMGTSNRRRCVVCYSKVATESGRNVAIKKTPHSRWKCDQCEKHYCVTCFCVSHECTM